MKDRLKLSPAGVALIKGEESFKPVPYNDPSQNATIAWGHLLHMGPVNQADWKKYGSGVTEAQGEIMLASDYAWAEEEVNNVVETQLNQNQFDAMVSFTFNEGSGTLEKSSVLTLLNEDKLDEACAVMLKYKYSDHEILPGLVTRREKEVALFETAVA